MNISEKSLNTLELPAVLNMLAQEAVSQGAKEAALGVSPSAEPAQVNRLLQEVSAAKLMMTVRQSPSFYGVKDVRASLGRAGLGGTLNTRELLDIAGVLRAARAVKGYIGDDGVGKTCIDSLFYALRANKFLEEKIGASIAGEDEIADAASADLTSIRRQMRAAAAKARDALQKILSSPALAKALQEPIITMRSDRYVIPVKAECKGSIPGLVHDISSSGMTVFVEPMAAVKANNELRELAAKEKLEIERILAELSADCAEHAEDISSDYAILVRLDLIFAKAKLSYKLDCQQASTEDGGIILRHARHPLLDKAKAVPIDLELGRQYDTLVITGPNTGGKTVSLKTIGLLAAMNQCGLHIPAADGCNLPVFGKILADIGDEQSIEQNLSTFSAHMTNIVEILDECDGNSLLLFDELGAGTDPTEGAALAISIIEYARRRGAMIAATTHYAELKIYATNEKGVQNASCEFDVETLRPTYRLLVGIPGKSNAFAISGRLGLNSAIIDDAKSRINSDSVSFEATIEKLEQTRRMLEKDRDEAAKKLREAEQNAKKAALLRAELEVRLEKADIKSKREAERIISEARATAEEVFAQLDNMRRASNEQENIRQVNEARSELRRRLNVHEQSLRESTENENDEKSSRPIKVGDTVKIKSMGVTAEVVAVSEDRTLSLRAGIMNVSAGEDDVLLVESSTRPQKKKPVQGTTVSLRASVMPEIDLRGMETVEAVIAAERYIDSAVMAKLQTVTIIHGKGTGALRTAVQQMLRQNKAVRSFRLGRYGEGESGVTVVELK